MRKATIFFFSLFPLLSFFSLIWSSLLRFHLHFLTHTLLHNLMPFIIFQFSDIYLLFFKHYPWACSRGGECNGYGYLIHYSLFSHILFSTIVYIYLQRHFSPLSTTTVYTFAIFTIERGPVYLRELRCKVSPKPITLFYTSHPPPVGYYVIALLRPWQN